MHWAMEIKSYFILLFLSTSEAVILTKRSSFTEVKSVNLFDLDRAILTSTTDVPSISVCAVHCEEDMCLSFSYSNTKQSCETFSISAQEEDGFELQAGLVYVRRFPNCSSVPAIFPSGVYSIKMPDLPITNLYCDMDTKDGPWTVIQRRTNGNLSFYRGWNDYSAGFGDLSGDFWLGNNLIHLLTRSLNILRIDLETWDGIRGHTHYRNFRLENETMMYKLSFHPSSFDENITGDALGISNGQPFTTFDSGNDHYNCAVTHSGAWWYRQCTGTNLNGQLLPDNGDNIQAVFWWYFPTGRTNAPLRKTWMMIR
ncbi:microfibril-associated glycoprotein 4-like [Argopecten irradians]|uniref:microfibril-associated glycoprotein 4-like n=1 Tax=Argopecten irradians TaxID=31199 RepID=UPI0037190413